MWKMTAIFVCWWLSLGALSTLVWATPPPWAPAHGWRAKHHYVYYPRAQVYYAPDRGLYFWYDGGRWQFGARLPSGVRLEIGQGVRVELDTERPYTQHTVVLRQYPGR